jgi:CheY-like chemotaxis protein
MGVSQIIVQTLQARMTLPITLLELLTAEHLMKILVVDEFYALEEGTQLLFRYKLCSGRIVKGDESSLTKQLNEILADVELEFFSDGYDALKRFRKHGPFDVVITAFGQTGMGCNAFMQAIRQENPYQPILFYTASASEELKDEYEKSHIAVGAKWDSEEGFLWTLIHEAIAKSPKPTTQ